jgi:predicted lipoprotein with Yx(FWY)xxD motif
MPTVVYDGPHEHLKETIMWRLHVSLIVLLGVLLPAVSAPGALAARPDKNVTLVKVAHNSGLGYSILVTGKGFTLYYWTQEKPGTIACTADCATSWPPLLVPKGVKVPKTVKGASGKFGVITRPDGKRQVTYKRHALYTYFDDRKPGDTLCQNVGGWFVIKVSAR